MRMGGVLWIDHIGSTLLGRPATVPDGPQPRARQSVTQRSIRSFTLEITFYAHVRWRLADERRASITGP